MLAWKIICSMSSTFLNPEKAFQGEKMTENDNGWLNHRWETFFSQKEGE
jgi:hypothetical protein